MNYYYTSSDLFLNGIYANNMLYYLKNSKYVTHKNLDVIEINKCDFRNQRN